MIRLTSEERQTLERWTRAPSTPQRIAARSRMVLLLAQGLSGRAVARTVGVSRHTVDLWRGRFVLERCPSLLRDRPGRGRKPRAEPAAQIEV